MAFTLVLTLLPVCLTDFSHYKSHPTLTPMYAYCIFWSFSEFRSLSPFIKLLCQATFFVLAFLKKLFIWQLWVLVVACVIFSWGMWNLVLRPGIDPKPPALGVQSLSYWTTREVPCPCLSTSFIHAQGLLRQHLQWNFLFLLSLLRSKDLRFPCFHSTLSIATRPCRIMLLCTHACFLHWIVSSLATRSVPFILICLLPSRCWWKFWWTNIQYILFGFMKQNNLKLVGSFWHVGY